MHLLSWRVSNLDPSLLHACPSLVVRCFRVSGRHASSQSFVLCFFVPRGSLTHSEPS